MTNDNIILIGMPGSGKSTVGRALAARLGMDFLDVDDVIAAREGTCLQDILDAHGVDFVLDREAEAVCSVDCSNTVIATGGSVVLRESGMAHLRALGPLVYLRVPLSDLESRVRNLTTRGIAMEKWETLADVFARRSPLYEAYADCTVDFGRESLDTTVRRVCEQLQKGTTDL